MRTFEKTDNIASAMFGKTRRSILALLFSHVDEEFYLREIVRLVDCGRGSVSRELKNLEEAGIIQAKRRGRQIFYYANPDCPVYPEIRNLIIKTAGVADVLKTALNPLLDRIKLAFIYGSIASASEKSSSDIDVMIVGDVSTREVVSVLSKARDTLRREINPSVYSAREFKQKNKSGHPFISRIVKEKKILIHGDIDEFAGLGK
jgi:predicted nucleotidyltransferase